MVIKARARNAVIGALTAAGRHSSPQVPRVLNGAANFIETGRRLREAGIALRLPVASRYAVFDRGIELAGKAEQPLYLEFGVWRGESMRYWAQRLTGPTARLVGFDSFEGLPERWTGTMDAGHFSTAGQTPQVDDPRVSFVKGWFAESLPTFDIPSHDLLIVNVDADLYSSAVTVLRWAAPLIKLGDLLYFDEFHDRQQEGRAFHEFLDESGHEFEMLACTHGVSQVLFRRGA